MTTAAYNRTAPFIRRALADVKQKHCRAPAYAPAAPVSDHTECTACGCRLNYTVAVTGMTDGRCTTRGCIQWASQ